MPQIALAFLTLKYREPCFVLRDLLKMNVAETAMETAMVLEISRMSFFRVP